MEDDNPHFFSFDTFARRSTLYKPSNAPLRLGATFSVGANALVFGDKFGVGLLPIPYIAVGPEVHLFKYIYAYPHVANIGLPFSNPFEVMIFYRGVDAGLYLPFAEKKHLYITFGIKSLFTWYCGDYIGTEPVIKNVSIGFQF